MFSGRLRLFGLNLIPCCINFFCTFSAKNSRPRSVCIRCMGKGISSITQSKKSSVNKQNLVVLDGLPDLDEFMFAPSRNQLRQVADFLIDLQQCQCFYCGKSLKSSKYAVDHFIPWSLYPAELNRTGFVGESIF